MKNRKYWYQYLWLLMSFFMACSGQESNSCQSAAIDDDSSYPVLIHEFYAQHPFSYQGYTFIDSIDKVVSGKRFINKQPDHSFHFNDCKEAQSFAESDFRKGMPTLIQFNGFGGDFPLENEIYALVMGVFIKNTGCSLYQYADCYNEKMWSLILEYREGTLDCDCEPKMRKYFQSIQWQPAIINGDSIDAVVAFQFMG